MKKPLPKYPRILAIAPSSRGFGYALVEGLNTLVDWEVKSVSGNKNAGTVAKVGELIAHYQPDVMVLEDTLVKPFRRAPRIRMLTKQLIRLGNCHKVKVALFSREKVRKAFFDDSKGTKHALAGILANKFPDELSFRLPPKRRPWMSEDYRMAIFDAVALALALRGSHRPNQNKNNCSLHD